MNSGVESLFPLALGIIFLLLLTGALFTSAIPVVVLLTGTLYFAGGILFGRPHLRPPWGTGIALLAPFFVTSVFLVVTFGSPLLIFPVLAAGGVAAGIAARRRTPSGAGPFMLAALWIGFVIVMALFVAPGLLDRLKLAGIAPG
jgi:hypothetical protein